MNSATNSANYDVGIAGSITMTVLIIAMTFLMISFYRRYKRAADKSEDEKKNS